MHPTKSGRASKQGRPAYDEKPTYSGDKVSTIAILTENGINAPYTYSESLTAPVFVYYLDTFIIPIINDGQTLIMDHPVHHANIVLQYLIKNNINFIFLPPYSPELNPIEEAFSKIKQYNTLKNRSQEYYEIF